MTLIDLDTCQHEITTDFTPGIAKYTVFTDNKKLFYG